MMRHAASAPAPWTAPGEVWEYVSQLVSSYHDQHDCQVRNYYSFGAFGLIRFSFRFSLGHHYGT